MRRRRPIPAPLALCACLVVQVLGCTAPSPPPPAGSPAPAATPVALPPPPAPPAVPSGTVVAFFGTSLPEGWVLCDGRTTASGRLTPDLRNRFILGLDPATGAVGEQGGSANHSHRARTGAPREKDESLEEGNDEHAANDGHTHDVAVDAAGHLPPYVKLVFIMKE